MRIIVALILGVLLIGCKKKQAPKSPESVLLVHPSKNSECTTSVDLTNETSEVEFRWNASKNTDSYVLIVTNLNLNTKQSMNTSATSLKLPLQKGTPYSWGVSSKNASVIATAQSETWRFYNPGSLTSYAPFSAEIISPKNGTSVSRDINNDIVLNWAGADADNDIVGFEIYVSPENPPENLVLSADKNITNMKIGVSSNTVYYWKVITKDAAGNTSDSGVYDFRAL